MDMRSINGQVALSRVAMGMLYLHQMEQRSDAFSLIEYAISRGITTFDHADNYGNGACEARFGEWLAANKARRGEIQIVTKCGNIHPANDRKLDFPITYNTQASYILESVDASLKRLNTDYLDVLLLHRCDRLTDFEQVAQAFSRLRRSGKVRAFGVSNFSVTQFELLQGCFPELKINQMPYSVYDLTNFENSWDQVAMARGVQLMAYSPLAAGKIFSEQSEKAGRIRTALEEIRAETGAPSIGHVAYAFLYKSPANLIPVLGTTKPARIDCAVEALVYPLTHEQWYYLYSASLGHRMV